MSTAENKPTLTEAELAFLAMHEYGHQVAGRNSRPRSNFAEIADDIVINGKLKADWPAMMRSHLLNNASPVPLDKITILEDISHKIAPEQMRNFLGEVIKIKIKIVQAKAIRMGARRLAALKNKAARKAKKKAQSTRRRALKLLQSF